MIVYREKSIQIKSLPDLYLNIGYIRCEWLKKFNLIPVLVIGYNKSPSNRRIINTEHLETANLKILYKNRFKYWSIQRSNLERLASEVLLHLESSEPLSNTEYEALINLIICMCQDALLEMAEPYIHISQ